MSKFDSSKSNRRDGSPANDAPVLGRRNFLKGATLAGAVALGQPVAANAVPGVPPEKLKAAVPGPRQMALET
jgi:acetolactate synthase-1/2/3 large subunit